jgi:C4-dicarboxylate-specific signal transduction histidine kinase
LTSIIEKRISLHKALSEQQKQNNSLKSQLIKLAALANIGSASCMIAHEINNLLTPLTNYAALASSAVSKLRKLWKVSWL